jgi:hypothetical protein
MMVTENRDTGQMERIKFGKEKSNRSAGTEIPELI